MEHEQLTWSQAPADDLIIDMRGIYKRFYIGQPNELEILRGIDLQVKKGEFLSIVGASGSGKSTLMNIIGALDRPTEGTYTLDGVPMADVPDDMLSEIRNLKIGFVFQTFNLIPRTTALRNVELPMVYAGARRSPCTKRAKALLEIVGMGERMKHLPNELSGGQKQPSRARWPTIRRSFLRMNQPARSILRPAVWLWIFSTICMSGRAKRLS